MMEIGDEGIKEPGDIITAIQCGADWREISSAIQSYGPRIAGLIASALVSKVHEVPL